MREEAAENKLLQLLRERDRAGQEKEELKLRPKRKKVKREAVKSSVQEQIQFLEKIFHTTEPSSKYTKMQNIFYDELAKNLSLAEQVIYHYLYRLSLGHHKRICIVGYNALMKATGIKSRETIRQAVAGLVEKKYVNVIGDVGPKGSIYFIYLPEEIKQNVSREEILKTAINNSHLTVPENSILKNGILNISILNFDTVPENSILKNGILNISILNFDILNILKNSILKDGTVAENKIEKEKQPTVLKNSIPEFDTYMYKENNNNKKILSLKKMRERLVNKFYEKLNSRVSQEKKLKGYQEAEKLLENYTPEEIEYAIDWAVKNIPDIQSFALIPHVIDQALKTKFEEERKKEAEKIALQRAREQEEREKREKELQEKIDEIKRSLSKEELSKIHQEAESLVKAQVGEKKFGQDILVRVKENEIIRNLYLKNSNK